MRLPHFCQSTSTDYFAFAYGDESASERFIDAHKNLAILCIAQNPLYKDKVRTDKALRHFKRYFELGGNDEQVRRIYGTLLQFLKRPG